MLRTAKSALIPMALTAKAILTKHLSIPRIAIGPKRNYCEWNLRLSSTHLDWHRSSMRFLRNLNALYQEVEVGDSEATKHLHALDAANHQIASLANQYWERRHQSPPNAQLSSDLVRFNYRLARRLSVWNLVNRTSFASSESASPISA